jgi:hypothetical protein
MTSQIDHCPLKYTGEDIAAWRAKLLNDDTARQFAEHLTTCKTCQSNVYIFESTSRLLHRQYVPDLHARIWRNLRVQMYTTPHQGGISMATFRHSILPGLIGALAVIIIVVTIGRVLNNHISKIANTPTAATSTPIFTSSATPIAPSSAIQAWGSNILNTYALMHLPNGNTFYARDSFQDGSVLVGAEVTPSQGQSMEISMISTYTISTGAVRHLYTINDGHSADVKTDGRYIAWISPEIDTGGPDPHRHQVVGYADLQSGKVTIMFNQDTYVAEPNGTFAVNNGYFVWNNVQSQAMNMTNMATGVTQTLPMNSQSIPQLNWPYLLYYSFQDTMLHLYNIQAGQDIALNLNDAQHASIQKGTTVYWIDKQMRIQQLDHADQPGAQPHVVYTLPSDPNEFFIGVTDRLIIWTDSKQAYAWDRALQKVVLLPVYIETNQYPATPQVFGNIVVLTTGPDAAHMEYTIIDSTLLPTSSP